MDTTKIILQDEGEHIEVVQGCLAGSDELIVALIDPRYTDLPMSIPYQGNYDSDFRTQSQTNATKGECSFRKEAEDFTNHTYNVTIHKSAIVSSFATMGERSMLLNGARIQVLEAIGEQFSINTGTQVDHDELIKDYVHLTPGIALCGYAQVAESAIGAMSILLSGIMAGRCAMVDVGAVVTKDLPDYTIGVGDPAKILKYLYRL